MLEKKKKEKKKSTGLVRERLKETGTPSKEVLSSFRLLDLSVKIAFSIVYIGLRTRSYRARHALLLSRHVSSRKSVSTQEPHFSAFGWEGRRERGNEALDSRL